MKFKVGKSDIHGKGLIVKKPISEGETIGLAHVDNKPTSVIGKYHNHADDPTATSLEMGNKRYLIALRDLNPGDEITTNYRLQPELEQPENFMRKGGSTKGLVSMPKPSKKGLASKAYTKSLDGTNKLFTENYLFEKPKSRKRKVFDPNAKYYQEGGDIPTLPLREGRLAYERLVYNVNDKIAKANQGGYIELDLDNDEIEQYKRQGYIVEELDSYQDGGQLYQLSGSPAVYRKVGDKWEVDWNRSGNFQPISKGDVKKRITNLNKNAKPIYANQNPFTNNWIDKFNKKTESDSKVNQKNNYTSKPVANKTKASVKPDPLTVKLNTLRKQLNVFDSQNNELGPSNMSDILKRAQIFKQIVELESQNQDKLQNTPRLDQVESVGSTMLTLGKYFMPKPIKTGVNYLLNISDAYDYLKDPHNESNKLSVASDILSPLKSKKTNVAPFSVMSDIINLNQQTNKFENAKNIKYEQGGFIETELIPEEIEWYKSQGYTVEELY